MQSLKISDFKSWAKAISFTLLNKSYFEYTRKGYYSPSGSVFEENAATSSRRFIHFTNTITDKASLA